MSMFLLRLKNLKLKFHITVIVMIMVSIPMIYDLIVNHHVSRANDPVQNNTVIIIQKNNIPKENDFYEYIVMIQIWFIAAKLLWFRAQCPYHRYIVEKLHNANSIVSFN